MYSTSLLIILTAIFFGIPAVYYLYLWYMSSKPWNLKIDEKYTPPVTVIIPTYNEEKTIRFKLLNLNKVEYPKEKIQVILIDDASTDATIQEVLKFVNEHPELNLEIICEKVRRGKSKALNIALKHANHEIIIVSDADTLWSSDILINALPLLSDPSVGAITGRQMLFNPQKSLLSQTEEIYLDIIQEIVKLGQSKIHSTLIFHGLFSAYRRKFLEKFNLETDDSGTALDIIQKGARTIYARKAKCYEISSITWKGKVRTKLRRASQLIGIYVRCLKLFLRRRLLLPFRVAIPEIFIYLVNPIIFPLLIVISFLFFVNHLVYFLYMSIVLFFILAVSPKFRLLCIEALQDNCILLLALFAYLFKKKFLMWETLQESRGMLNEEILKRENLI